MAHSLATQPTGQIRVRTPHSSAPSMSYRDGVSSTKTGDPQEYICKECGHTTKSQVGMYYHQNKHKGIYPYYCPYCDKGQTGTTNLGSHLKSKHNIEKPFRCMFCPTVEAKVTEYIRHVHGCPHRRENIYGKKW